MEDVKDASGDDANGARNGGGAGGAAAGGNSGQGSAAGGASGLHYSIPGILHFLQHEWSRFEMERSQWEVEKAELQVH